MKLKKLSILSRSWHRQIGLLIALPALVIITTGFLLQVKSLSPWLQPPPQKASGLIPKLTFEEILDIASQAKEAEIQTWKDIQRIDVWPNTSLVKVRAKNNYEIQIDAATGDLLNIAYRRSAVITAIHNGTWFHPIAKYLVFLPTAFGLAALTLTGLFIYFPLRKRSKKEIAKKASQPANQTLLRNPS